MDAPNAHGATVQICGVNEQPADLSLKKQKTKQTNKIKHWSLLFRFRDRKLIKVTGITGTFLTKIYLWGICTYTEWSLI